MLSGLCSGTWDSSCWRRGFIGGSCGPDTCPSPGCSASRREAGDSEGDHDPMGEECWQFGRILGEGTSVSFGKG